MREDIEQNSFKNLSSITGSFTWKAEKKGIRESGHKYGVAEYVALLQHQSKPVTVCYETVMSINILFIICCCNCTSYII